MNNKKYNNNLNTLDLESLTLCYICTVICMEIIMYYNNNVEILYVEGC